MLISILLIFTAAYSLMILFFAAAAANARYPINRRYRPSVSIIIAARNEEKSIGACLDSIVQLTYPSTLVDVIIVDDRSEDSTASIIRLYSEKYPHIHLLTAKPGSGNLRGKTNAVTQGIEASRGEIVLFTDADCAVPQHWVEDTVQYYTNEAIGLVAGFTELRASRIFEEMQTLDWFYLFSVAAGALKLNYPVTAVGNNLSVRRAAYDAVGGYRVIPFSVTEDYALFHAITTTKPFRACFPMDEAMLVRSKACPNWSDLHRQKLRWFTGGRDMELKSIAILSMSYIFNLFILLGPLLFPLPELLIAIGAKVAVDLVLLMPSLARFNKLPRLRAFPVFEVYFFLYVLLYPPLVFLGKSVTWKEREY